MDVHVALDAEGQAAAAAAIEGQPARQDLQARPGLWALWAFQV